MLRESARRKRRGRPKAASFDQCDRIAEPVIQPASMP
jgi:hypothetical protein